MDEIGKTYFTPNTSGVWVPGKAEPTTLTLDITYMLGTWPIENLCLAQFDEVYLSYDGKIVLELVPKREDSI